MSSNNSKLPTRPQIVKNLLTAVAEEAQALIMQRPSVTEEEQDKRMKLCESCDRFLIDQIQCSACGCFMKVKTKFKSALCPLGKW